MVILALRLSLKTRQFGLLNSAIFCRVPPRNILRVLVTKRAKLLDVYLCVLPCAYRASAVTATWVLSFPCDWLSYPSLVAFWTYKMYVLVTTCRNFFWTFLVSFPIPYFHNLRIDLASVVIVYTSLPVDRKSVV